MNRITRLTLSGLVAGMLAMSCSTARTAEDATNAESNDERISGGIAEVASESARKVDTITSKEADDQPLSFTEQLLQGRVPGVVVTERPTGGFTIRIRGNNSLLGSSEPLFVVDGMQIMHDERRGLSWLNIHDIEKIEVLKDVSATALYGSRGSNGVIIITTKRGAEGP